MCGHFFDHGIGKVLAQVAPIAAAFIPGVGPLASAALAAGTSALSTKLQGGSWGDSLKSGALSGLGAAAMPVLGNAFQSMAPETAAMFGIKGGAQTIFDKGAWSGLGQTLGMGGADAAGAAAGSLQGPSGGTSGLTQAMSNPNVDMQAGSAVGAQTMASSYPQLSGATGAEAPGSVLGKAGEWASSHAIPLAMGAATLYSGLKTAQDRTKQQEAIQTAAAAKNAQDLANWKLTLNTPPLNRQQTPGNADIDYNRYGFGPERQFLTNNQTSPGTPPVATMAEGGSVRSDDGEPDMDSPAMQNMRNGSASYEDYKQYKREMSKNKKTPQTDGEPDMDPIGKAVGGKMKSLRMKTGGFPKKNGKISGPGGPTGDKIRAMLSDGEYVIKAKSVSHLGRGNNNKGAKILDKLNNAPADRLKALGKKIHKLKGVA